jgi:hypothetical protein
MPIPGFYKKCPHTCTHKMVNRPTYNYIFFNVGGSFDGHVKSKHPNYNQSCRGHQNNPHYVEWIPPVREEMVEL